MSWLSKIGKKAEHWVASRVPHTTAAEKREAMQAAKEQIDYYKKAKEDMETSKKESDAQKKMERDKINEKEIRARKRTFIHGGFLSEPSAAPTDKLG